MASAVGAQFTTYGVPGALRPLHGSDPIGIALFIRLRPVSKGITVMHILTILGWCSLALAFLCAITIALDEVRHPQNMAVMNIVWPVTALYLSVFAVWAYFRIGRGMSKEAMSNMSGDEHKHTMEQARAHPTFAQVAVPGSHCGAGCTLGDVVSEFGVFSLGITLFGSMLLTDYAVDYVVAWLFGIAFQDT